MRKDDLAFREELVSLLPRLRRFALALAGQRDLAEDLLQSAVERALRNLNTFQTGRRLDSWMFKIMQNQWIDMRRANRNALTDGMVGIDPPGEDGRRVVEARDDVRAARAAFESLAEEQRAVLTLVVIEGLSYTEAADALGVPLGTIMSRLSRARAAMSSQMQRAASPKIMKEY